MLFVLKKKIKEIGRGASRNPDDEGGFFDLEPAVSGKQDLIQEKENPVERQCYQKQGKDDQYGKNPFRGNEPQAAPVQGKGMDQELYE